MKKTKISSMASPISTTIKVNRKNSGVNSGLNSPLSRNASPSPLSKRQSSCFSSSPEKINISILDFKKIVYITN